MKPFKSSCHKSLAETVVFNENLFWIKASLFVAFLGRCFSSRTMTLPPVHKWWNTKFDVWSCLCTEDEIKYNVFQVEQYSVDKSSWSWPMKQLSVLSHTQSLLLFNPILQQPWFLLCTVVCSEYPDMNKATWLQKTGICKQYFWMLLSVTITGWTFTVIPVALHLCCYFEHFEFKEYETNFLFFFLLPNEYFP